MSDAVIDASAFVDLLLETDLGERVATEVERHRAFHSPAHLDAEVLSALARLHRAGRLTAEQVAVGLTRLAEAPVRRHELPPLVSGAWERRANLRVHDALYVELSARLQLPLLTTDRRLAAALGITAITI